MEYLTDEQVKNKLNEGEIDAVIINYLPFANYLADRLASRCFTHEREDIRGEACIALVSGVVLLRGHPNPRGFLREKIRGHILNFVKRSNLIKTPDGEPNMTNAFPDCTIFDDERSNDDDMQGGSRAVPKQCWSPFDRGMGEVSNLVESYLFSDIEKKILKRKIDGHTLEEIAIECQMPYVQIQRILQGTKSRVVKILDGLY